MATLGQPAKTPRSKRILGLTTTELAVLIGLLILILSVLGVGGAYVINQNLNSPAQVILVVTATPVAGAIPTSTVLAYPTLPPEWTSAPEATSTAIPTEEPIATSEPPTSVPLSGGWQVADVYGYPGRKSITIMADAPIVGPDSVTAMPYLQMECWGGTMEVWLDFGLTVANAGLSSTTPQIVNFWYNKNATLAPGLFDVSKANVTEWNVLLDNHSMGLWDLEIPDFYTALISHGRMLAQTQLLSSGFSIGSAFFNLTGLGSAMSPLKTLCGVR